VLRVHLGKDVGAALESLADAIAGGAEARGRTRKSA